MFLFFTGLYNFHKQKNKREGYCFTGSYKAMCPNLRHLCPPRKHLARPTGVFGCHNWAVNSGIWWVRLVGCCHTSRNSQTAPTQRPTKKAVVQMAKELRLSKPSLCEITLLLVRKSLLNAVHDFTIKKPHSNH